MIPRAVPILLAAAAAAALAAAPTAERISRAEAVLKGMERGAFAEVVASFDATMAAGLPAAKLEEVWTALLAQAGAFRAIEERRTQDQGKLLKVDFVCSFENGPLVVRIVLDAHDKVAGLWFKPAADALPASAPPEPPPDGVHEVEVTVGKEPWQLGGVIALPAAASAAHRVPAALLLAGSGPQDRDEHIGPNRPLRDVAWGLAARGIATLRYDKRTHAHGDRMGGADVTVDEEVLQDAAAGLALLRTRPEVDPARLSLIGHSLGGTLAPLVAKQDGKVASLVLLAGGARPLDGVVRDQVQTLQTMKVEDSGSSPESLQQLLAEVDAFQSGKSDSILGMPRRYLDDLNRRDALGVAASLRLPVLLVQGGRDYQVTMADLALWKKALPKAKVKLYPDLSHLFAKGTGRATPREYMEPSHVAVEVIDDVAAFLRAGGAPARVP